jgi:hypothetical protein
VRDYAPEGILGFNAIAIICWNYVPRRFSLGVVKGNPTSVKTSGRLARKRQASGKPRLRRSFALPARAFPGQPATYPRSLEAPSGTGQILGDKSRRLGGSPGEAYATLLSAAFPLRATA